LQQSANFWQARAQTPKGGVPPVGARRPGSPGRSARRSSRKVAFCCRRGCHETDISPSQRRTGEPDVAMCSSNLTLSHSRVRLRCLHGRYPLVSPRGRFRRRDDGGVRAWFAHSRRASRSAPVEVSKLGYIGSVVLVPVRWLVGIRADTDRRVTSRRAVEPAFRVADAVQPVTGR
jgi:hypothetical protein